MLTHTHTSFKRCSAVIRTKTFFKKYVDQCRTGDVFFLLPGLHVSIRSLHQVAVFCSVTLIAR